MRPETRHILLFDLPAVLTWRAFCELGMNWGLSEARSGMSIPRQGSAGFRHLLAWKRPLALCQYIHRHNTEQPEATLRESPTGGWAWAKGYTLVELMMVVVILVIMVAVGLPVFSTMMRTSGVDAAAWQVAGSIREARAKAVRTGWEYRIFGGNGGGTEAYKNKYRLEGRRSTMGWPSPSQDNVQTANNVSEPWRDVSKDYPGVVLNPSNATSSFFLSFNSRGTVSTSSGFALSVAKSGTAKTVSVTLAGKVKIQ